MGRRAKPGFELKSRGGWAWIQFFAAGQTVRRSLGVPYHPQRSGAGEARRAREAAARYFADYLTGRVEAPTGRVTTPARLEELGAAWLDAIETPANRATTKTRTMYVRHWRAFAADGGRWGKDGRTPLERLVSDTGPADYAMARLRGAIRSTVQKELSSLFAFLAWCVPRGHLASVPPRPKLPRAEPGVRTGRQRVQPVEILPEEARAIVEALPEWSRELPEDRARAAASVRKVGAPFRVRDVFDFMWETGLRPSTIARIDVPRSFAAGATELALDNADDKARFGRSLPLSARARSILARVAPERGLIFGDHDYRAFLKTAALVALPKEKALAFARYDFRHGRATAWLESTGNMMGVAYLMGHKRLTTTNAYLRPNRRQGAAVIAASAEAETCTIDVRDGGTTENPAVRNTDRKNNTPRSAGASGGISQAHASGSSAENGLDLPADAGGGPDRCAFDARAEALTDVVRALAVERAVWDAFDVWAFVEEDEP